ncbi:MAG: oxidoreductase [Planctomycetes bacterium]|nr:oxidoreductase [Planctomycetota bacterium]
MLDLGILKTWLGVVVIAAPTTLLALLGAAALLGWRLSERVITRCVHAAVGSGLLAALAVLIIMLADGSRHVDVQIGDWVKIPHYHFSVSFVFDRLSVPLAILSFVLSGTIAAFAARYLHREGGFNRFFTLYALFLLGMVAASLAGTIETLFAGWELVGLSSALLVGYYQDRPAPARNGIWVWVIYRVSDAALLLAAVVLHHLTGEGDFAQLCGHGPWPGGTASLTAGQALIVGLLLLLAAAGKSGLAPFSGWLPRAMEGPTPSSAIFYGALSVHLGAFLLLRVSPILECSMWLSAAIVILGLTTAVLAVLVGRVQTDIKSALCYASLVQVGIIVAEIGLGFRYLALVHLLGHACLRTLQFLRAPTLLHDHLQQVNAIGADALGSASDGQTTRLRSSRLHLWLYRFALERAYFDALLLAWVVEPCRRLFRCCDALERRWTDWLAGTRAAQLDITAVDPAGKHEDRLAS